MKELMPTIVWTVIPALAIGFLILLYNFMVAPYRLQEKKLASELNQERQLRINLERELAAKTEAKKAFSIYWLDDAREYETDDEDFEIIENDSTKSVITGFIKINTMNKITVESIELNIEDYLPVKPVKEWMGRIYYGSELPIKCKFDIPPNIPRGKRIAKVSAIVDNERYTNDSFILNLPIQELQSRNQF